MNESLLLNRLKQAQAAYALEAVRKPSDKTEFEYGFRSGYVNGLEQAMTILLETMRDDHDRDNKL